MTEAVGGPLGRRTAPGSTSPGFFTVERVLILLTALSALVAIAAKGHCRQAGWTTPDQYSTVCWSQFPNSFVENNLASAFPYFSRGADFDGSPLAGIVAGVTARLTAGAGGGASRLLAYFDFNAILVAVLWMVTVVLVARSAHRRPWDAALVAASPALLVAAYVGWDFWAAALVSLGIYLFARRRTLWAGLSLGLAVAAAPYALLVLLVLLVLGLRSRQTARILEAVAAAAVGWLIPVAPVLAINPGAWGGHVAGVLTHPATESSIYGSYNLVAGRIGAPMLGDNAVNAIAAVLVAAVVAGVAALALLAPRRPRLAQLAFMAVAGLTVVGKDAQPWHAIWLLPLLALALPRWRPALLWQAAVVTHFIALLLFQGKVFGDVSNQHAIDLPYFVLAALLNVVATCALIALTLRDVLHPEFDVVRRAGVDDPQGGVLSGGGGHD
ncbi:glycosyltransferase 87 family protein [Specibacter sp. RAF43]